jgi:hypothetical protein
LEAGWTCREVKLEVFRRTDFIATPLRQARRRTPDCRPGRWAVDSWRLFSKLLARQSLLVKERAYLRGAYLGEEEYVRSNSSNCDVTSVPENITREIIDVKKKVGGLIRVCFQPETQEKLAHSALFIRSTAPERLTVVLLGRFSCTA